MATILIVDDQPNILLVLKKILLKQGHKVLQTTDPFEVLDILSSRQFDALITDAKMPGINGFELVKNIRRNSKLKNLPIIMLTGKRNAEDVQRGIDAGINGYVIKPINAEVVIQKLDQVLGKQNGVLTGRLNKVAVAMPVSWKFNTEVIEVNEAGVVVRTNAILPIRSQMTLNDGFYAALGITSTALVINEYTSDLSRAGFFTVTARFVALSVEDKAVLRAWIAKAANPVAA